MRALALLVALPCMAAAHGPGTHGDPQDAAVSAALGMSEPAHALVDAEMDALRVAVAACWNVGALSPEARATPVTVAVSMNPDGTPRAGSVRLVSPATPAAEEAFAAARRAILRCGHGGLPLPADTYESWSEIEMTFDPAAAR